MSAFRKLALCLIVLGAALLPARPTEARPSCPAGPTCSSASNPCPTYCGQLGWPYGLCNFQTGCCVCSD